MKLIKELQTARENYLIQTPAGRREATPPPGVR